MHAYHLQDEFRDLAAERQLLAAFAQQPTLYFELFDTLSIDVFTETQELESARVVFTANALNLFNRHYLTNLNTDIDALSFGRFSGGSMGRSIQMALRIEF